MNKIKSKSVILIVDDNPTNLNVLLDILEDAGFETLFAEDGESALERVTHAKPDLILLDVLMPEVDGFQTCIRLKKNPDTKNIPVIFMTALSDSVDKVHGFNLGAVDYITKPIDNIEVLSRIKTHLTILELRQQLEKKNDELKKVNENLENLVDQKSSKIIKQEKSATIGRLVQGMVHNLKNPLNAILGYNSIVSQIAQELNNKDIKLPCDIIEEASNRMYQMMDNLMVKSRMDQSTQSTLVNINQLVKQEISLLNANTYFKYNVEKQLSFDDSIKNVNMVYTTLSQVFHNLINNALDAMRDCKDRKAILSITTRQDSKCYYLDVKDNGKGIEDEDLDKIFDPFYTTKSEIPKGSDTIPTGTGLGLHTCIELLKSVNGLITVKSKSGRGSSFTVHLPKHSKLKESTYE